MHSFSNWGDVIRRIIKPAFIAMLLTISSTEAAFAKLNYTSGETSDGLRYIVVNGEFEYSDNLSEFSDKASLQKPSFIGFNSGGGNVIKAMELGRLIRSHRLSTVQLKGPECSSACALAFLGGVGRIAEPGAIGVHKSSFSAEDAIDTQTAVSAVQELTAEVITYIIEMGADPALLQLSLRYDKDDIRYLSRSEMHHYKVITSISSQRKTVSRLPVPFREQSGTITESERVLSSKPEEDIIEFVRRYHSAWSSNNRASLHFIEQAYAKKVDFYGKLMSREAVIEEKIWFMNRWPKRIYTIRAGSEIVRCGNRECSIDAIVNWYAHSDQRGKTAKGVAEFQLTLDLQHNVITSENGKTLRFDRR